ncbi:MAG TPA: phage tail protein [Kofleriaceae bacterium]|jgi:phage tail-like protein
MADRKTPYPAFNFTVAFDGSEDFGGFSDVSGIQTELAIAEYREGTDPENHVRKVQGLTKINDVSLKRGIIDSGSLWDWIQSARVDGPDAKRTVVITLLDEKRVAVQKYTLRQVIPLKWTGPTLAGKGGGDVAMEEIVLSCEALDYGEAGG